MNAHDLALWRKAIEKIDADALELLTADERELVELYGGPDMLRRRQRRPARAVAAVKPRRFEPGPLLTKALESEGAHPSHFKTEADFLAWFARLRKARHQ